MKVNSTEVNYRDLVLCIKRHIFLCMLCGGGVLCSCLDFKFRINDDVIARRVNHSPPGKENKEVTQRGIGTFMPTRHFYLFYCILYYTFNIITINVAIKEKKCKARE